jgi:hypothetical protein
LLLIIPLLLVLCTGLRVFLNGVCPSPFPL